MNTNAHKDKNRTPLASVLKRAQAQRTASERANSEVGTIEFINYKNIKAATLQTILCGSATVPCKHSASPPVWLAATPTPPTLPQTSAAAASPATRGGGVAIGPIAWGRPPPQRHPPTPPDAAAARVATGKGGGWLGGRREGAPSPSACSAKTVHGTVARPPVRPPARGKRPTRRSGPSGRHELLTTATRGHQFLPPHSLVSLTHTPPRHAVAAAGSCASGDHRTRQASAACHVRGHATVQRVQLPPARMRCRLQGCRRPQWPPPPPQSPRTPAADKAAMTAAAPPPRAVTTTAAARSHRRSRGLVPLPPPPPRPPSVPKPPRISSAQSWRRESTRDQGRGEHGDATTARRRHHPEHQRLAAAVAAVWGARPRRRRQPVLRPTEASAAP